MKKRDGRKHSVSRGSVHRKKIRRRKRQIERQSTWKNMKKTFKNINWSFLPKISKWMFQIIIVVLLAFVCVWYFGQRVSVVGDSMKPILENGDVVLVNRIAYNTGRPKRGDVIVFKPKGNENSHYYIKRIIGLPGETVSIVENNVYIDGEKLEEAYDTTAIDNVGVVGDKLTLGSDEYFVLGDDRQNSEDSRDADVGNVKYSYIYGKAWYVFSPKEHWGLIRRK